MMERMRLLSLVFISKGNLSKDELYRRNKRMTEEEISLLLFQTMKGIEEDLKEIVEGGDFASISHQGMIKNMSLFISANHMKVSTSLHAADIEKQSCTAMYKGSDEEKRTHALWEHSHGSFIHEEMEEGMVDGRHLEVRNPFSFLDDTFSMRTPQLKEKLLPTADPRPLWFWKAMHEEEISWRDFTGGALQHIMK